MVKRFFSKEEERKIAEAIAAAENGTTGEIRVHVKRRCKKDALREAEVVFKKLRMHRTKQRNAILILLAPESRDFAIFGDQSLHRLVGDEFWRATRDLMLSYFSKGALLDGIVEGVRLAGEKLKAHFPTDGATPNELSDEVTED